MKNLKTYQSFARTEGNSELVNTEIKASSMTEAKAWFKSNCVENEKVYLMK